MIDSPSNSKYIADMSELDPSMCIEETSGLQSSVSVKRRHDSSQVPVGQPQVNKKAGRPWKKEILDQEARFNRSADMYYLYG